MVSFPYYSHTTPIRIPKESHYWGSLESPLTSGDMQNVLSCWGKIRINLSHTIHGTIVLPTLMVDFYGNCGYKYSMTMDAMFFWILFIGL